MMNWDDPRILPDQPQSQEQAETYRSKNRASRIREGSRRDYPVSAQDGKPRLFAYPIKKEIPSDIVRYGNRLQPARRLSRQ